MTDWPQILPYFNHHGHTDWALRPLRSYCRHESQASSVDYRHSYHRRRSVDVTHSHDHNYDGHKLKNILNAINGQRGQSPLAVYCS